MATHFGSKDGILVRIMTLEDYPEVRKFMRSNFYESEPISASAGENLQDYHPKQNDELHTKMIEQETSLLALDENNGGRIVGVVLAGPQQPSDVQESYHKYKTLEDNFYGRFVKLITTAAFDANVFERFGESIAIYSHMTCVDVAMRGRGLGSRLAAALMEIGRQKDLRLVVAYCTSYYSAKQKMELGMECVHSVVYADYKDENGKVIFTPEAPHTQLRIVVGRL